MNRQWRAQLDVKNCTFGSPCVGNAPFVGVFNEVVTDAWRVATPGDVVTKMPPLLGYASIFSPKHMLCVLTVHTVRTVHVHTNPHTVHSYPHPTATRMLGAPYKYQAQSNVQPSSPAALPCSTNKHSKQRNMVMVVMKSLMAMKSSRLICCNGLPQ